MKSLTARLDPLFKPRHVAVIGASRSPGKHGNRVIGNIAIHGFGGRVSLINPAGGEIDGAPCFKSIEDAPGAVDCAIIVIPAEHVVEAVRQCANARVRSIVIAGVGFAELGTEIGRQRQQQILDIARANDITLLGPNTNGVFNRSFRLSLGTNTSHGEPIDAGTISIVSHSGALFNHFARYLRRLGTGLSKFVPVGNEADLTMLDILDYLVDDDDTTVIGMIIEGITDGRRFRRLAEKARDARKPIVAFKLGRSRIGAESSVAHSSRLAGEARAYDALFRLCNVACVPTIEALAGGCTVLAGRSSDRLTEDQRLTCIANSGAGAALLADFADRYQIPLVGDEQGNWQEPIAGYIAQVKTRAQIRHPIDTGNLGNVRLLGDVLDALSKGGATGPLVVFSHTILTPGRAAADAKVIIERRRRHGSPVLVLSPGGLGEEIEGPYQKNGVPVFRDTATAFDSLHCHYATIPSATAAYRLEPQELADGSKHAVEQCLHAAKGKASPILSELDSAELLRAVGVPVVESRRVDSFEQAQGIAEELGFPVVLKALAPDVAHKNRLGFVIPNILDAAFLQRSHRELQERIASQGFARENVPIIVQPMLRSSAELIVGVTRDAVLGHFLIVGLGGVYTEVLDLTIMVPMPFSPSLCREWVEGTRIGKLIQSVDGSGRLMDDVLGTVNALQTLIVNSGDAIEEIDINPLLIGPWGCKAVDALVVLRGRPESKCS
jgi:acyl-CoA synthetase (NDP forming)